MIRLCDNCTEGYEDQDSDAEAPEDYCSETCESEAGPIPMTCSNCDDIYFEEWDSDFCSDECEAEYYEEEE